MFKELKVIKLIVFFGLLILIIQKIEFKNTLLTQFYTDRFSFNSGEKLNTHTSTRFFMGLNVNYDLTNILGVKVDEIPINLIKNKVGVSKILENGLKLKSANFVQLSKKIPSGVYLLNNKFPIIVKPSINKKIVVVYPYMNNILYTSENLENAFGAKIPKTSLNRTATIDVYSKGILPFFKTLNYDFGYIADLDLEDSTTFFDSKLLIIYGKSTCWTLKMQQNFTKFIKKGGNILFISSYIMNDAVNYDKKKNNIQFYNPKKNEKALASWVTKHHIDQEKYIGISYVNAGYSDKKYYLNPLDNHPILKGIKAKKINLNADLFAAPPAKWYDDLPRIDLDSLGFYKGEIIAYSRASYRKNDKGIKGIFMLQPDSTSGKIVSLGTEDWCLEKNIGKKKELQIITKNAIDYLLK